MSEQAESLRLRVPTARFVFQGGPAARLAAGKAYGVPFPETACRASVLGERAVLWMGPDEHLLLAPDGSQERILAELAIASSRIAHSLVDVSHRQVAITVAGRAARSILASGCPLDLDSAAFPVGMCTRTLFGKAEALLWRRSAEEYHLELGRSFAGYVLGWLREAERGG
jgi:sarcosine oxidase, subunit gamma